MIDQLPLLLARTANGSDAAAQNGEIPSTFMGELPMNDIWDFIVNVSWLQAVVYVAFGIIYLIYGWRVFKALVVINFSIMGLFLGMTLGNKLGSPLWGGIIGTASLGICTWPFMKYCVAVLGAIAGAVLGAAIWRTATLPDPLIWCGALAGLIAGGFLAFSSFKNSIMLFSSLQGSVFMVIGILALLNDYPNFSTDLSNAVNQHVFLLPSLLIVPTIAGFLFQQKLLKKENDWALPG
jgi:hypothetical protein